jgi:serine/threonine protein kinase/Tol biopolymer transport system component
LIIGSTISHYKIVKKLGEGGMGVVYKAEDTKLNRQVALKFLAQHLLDDAEAKERFLREAQAAAALDHPNICTVYEIGDAEGKTYIAMSFLEGESLEERITEGPLALNKALDIARQVADGLQAAHAKGVFHRDIKPANIIISPEGRATIMDFGLARLTEASRLTKVDTAMGTVAYMSPEQAQGMEVDGRTDIWALGCVLYEMVSGQRPFQGQYDQALLYEIVHEEPAALTGLRTGVPVELEFVVGKCLTKDHDDRPESAKEVSKELRTLAEKLKSGRSTILSATQMTGAVPATMTGAHTLNPAAALPPDSVVVRRGSQQALQALAVLATFALLVVGFLYFSRSAPEPSEKLLRRFSIDEAGLVGAQISPDGKYIAYTANTVGKSGLWLRNLATETSRELPGTEGIAGALGRAGLFWSADSSSLGFSSGPNNGPNNYELKRVSIDGGSPLKLCELPTKNPVEYFMGGTWSPDGERIVFSSGGRLYEVAARGGQPQVLFDSGDDPRPYSSYPHFLPPGQGPAALVYTTGITDWGNQNFSVLNLESGERWDLGPGRQPVFTVSGYLVHGSSASNDSGLWALPFSLATLEPTGDDFPISVGGEMASLSRDGTLTYQDQTGSEMGMKNLVWRDHSGEMIEEVGQPQPGLREFALSPDRRWVATTVDEPASIWIHDLNRATTTRLTFSNEGPGGENRPSWAPSGKEISYVTTETPNRLMRRMVDGSGEPSLLVESEFATVNADWSRDGRYVVFSGASGTGTRSDILYVELVARGGPFQPQVFLSTPSGESNPKLSPDGRFVAYVSNESGQREVYVRPFPSGDGRWQVSGSGGEQPRWRNDGKELFYVENDTMMMAVPASTGQKLTFGQPQMLFESEDLNFRGGAQTQYDVSADGQRFLTSTFADTDTSPTIHIVLNWSEEFRDREQ